MAAEPLSPEDATLLCATDPSAQLQIGAVCFFQGAPLRDADGRLRLADLRDHVEARLHLSPRFRQRIARVPFDAARPVWVDDDHFDIADHVRVAPLPAPGGAAGLRVFVADLLGRPLDPARPVWDIWLLDGLEDDRVAVVLRVHHAMADGLTLLDAALLLLDPEPRDDPDRPAERWNPERSPSALRLLADALVVRRRHQLRILTDALRAAFDPRRVAGAARTVLGGVAHATGDPGSLAPSTDLDGPVGRRRDVVWSSLPLEPLLAVRRARGVTLNDVVLAIVADGVGRHLGHRTAGSMRERPPRVLVPVGAAGAAGAAEEGGNVFSFLLADLPVAPDDPAERLARIHDQLTERKASLASSWASRLFSVVDLVPLPLLRRLGPAALARQPFVNLAVTNIPGSREPMFLLGSRMEELHPIVTGVGNIACVIGVLSYRDTLGVGVTVDPDVVPDPDGLLDHIRGAAADLVATL
jgi:WS/DGAT/MGAT family acyltransferase